MKYMCDNCVRWTAGHLQRSSRMLVKHMLAGCPVRGGLHRRKLISSNVLTCFIQKTAALKSCGFSLKCWLMAFPKSHLPSPLTQTMIWVFILTDIIANAVRDFKMFKIQNSKMYLFFYFTWKRVEISEEKVLILSVSVVSNVKMCANPHHRIGSCPVIFESSVSSFVHNMDQWHWFSGCE